MKNLDTLTIEELTALFVSIGERQYPHLNNDEIKPYNRLMKQMETIDKELRRRGVQARLALTGLFDHQNVQVRMQAARLCLGVARNPALDVLRKIAKEEVGPQKLHAGMAVALVEDGTVNPT